jgi:hypothetical protein
LLAVTPLHAQLDQKGQWSAVFSMPLVAVHAALMHTGQVLLFDAWEIPGTPSARLWNPSTNVYTAVPNGFAELFCAGHILTNDGRLLTTGGHNGGGVGTTDATVFDPTTLQWTPLANLNYARWYPSVTQLADGRTFTIGGAITRPDIAEIPEIMAAQGGPWTSMPGAQKDVGEYPQVYQAPNGRLFVNGSDASGISWLLDVNTNLWTSLGVSPASSGTSVMYRAGKIMMTGGGTANADPLVPTTGVIDLNAPTPSWRQTASMAFARAQHNLVLLPDGKVLVVGGATEISLETTSGVLTSEIWDPATELWTQVEAMTRPRMYHSVALLLPDGRVLAAGGGRLGPDELNGQFYSPPYLFKGARPQVTSAPLNLAYGQSFSVGTPDPSAVARVTFLRASSVTHGINLDQRFAELSFTQGTGTLTVQAPVDARTMPPGDYLLFVLNSDDVPSVARIVRLGGAAAAPSLLLSDASAAEGTASGGTAIFTVAVNGSTTQTVTVDYATANGTATAGSDYTAASGTLSFPPGVTSRTISVPITGDADVEPNETFTVTLSSAANASIADGLGVGTIVNDDAPVVSAITINDVSLNEGSGGGTPVAAFTVTLSPASAQSVLVRYRTVAGTAAAPGDFTSTNGTLTFAGGTTQQTIQVPIVTDSLVEPNETFEVELYEPTNGYIADDRGLGTIVDDDAGTVTATYVVAAGNDDVNEDGTAYAPTGSTVWLGTGETTGAGYLGLRFTGVTIPAGATVTAAHLEVDSSGTHWNALEFEQGVEASGNSAPFSPTARPSQRPLLPGRVSHASDVEWGNGARIALEDIGGLVQAAVQQPGWAGQALTVVVRGTGGAWSRKEVKSAEGGAATAPRLVVTYAVGGGGGNQAPQITTAQATPVSGGAPLAVSFTGAATDPEGGALTYTWTFGDGTTGTGATATHTYAAGTYTATLTVSDGSLSATSAPLTITATAPATPTLAIGDVSVTETDSGTVGAVFTVTLSVASAQTVTVGYATANGTATAGSDYVATSGTLSFTPGQTSRTITVPVTGDVRDESTETFVVNLSSAVGATITDAQGAGTIVDNDPTPALSISDVSITEGNSGSKNATFTVTLSAASGQAITVGWATQNGTATAPSDYATKSGSLSFAVGATSRSFTVSVKGDRLAEGNEQFFAVLSGAVNATIAKASGTATIVNDDGGAAAPQRVMVAVDGAMVTLSWSSGDVRTSSAYVVEVGTTFGGAELGRFPVGAATRVSGAPGPGTYYARIRAISPAGDDPGSSEMIFTTPPSPLPPRTPEGLTAMVGSDHLVTLNWNAASGNATTYVIDVGSASGRTDLVSIGTGNLDTTFTTIAPPGTYFVRVRALNAFGASAESNEVTVAVV